MKRFVILLVAASCLAGCNWALFEFRGQLKQLPKYSHWEDRPWGQTLLFSEPVLALADIRGIGLSPTPMPDGLLAIRYHYHTDKRGGTGETAMFFLMEGDKLRGIALPSVMLDMIGQRNLEALLRMAGGDSSPAASVRDVEKARVLRAVFGSDRLIDDRQLTVTFEPVDAGNRALKLEFEEGKRPAIYSTLRLIIGKPQEEGRARTPSAPRR